LGQDQLGTIDTPQSLHASFTGNLRFSGVSFSDVIRRATEISERDGSAA
jgi:hypothetical protein